MITASLAWPRNADASAVTASRISSGDPSWLASTGPCMHPVRAHRVRAHHAQPPRRLVLRQAGSPAAQPGQDVIGSQRGGLRRRHR